MPKLVISKSTSLPALTLVTVAVIPEPFGDVVVNVSPIAYADPALSDKVTVAPLTSVL